MWAAVAKSLCCTSANSVGVIHSPPDCLLLIIATSSVYSHLTIIFTDFLNVWLILLYLLGLCYERKMKFKEFNLELV
uniref:Uncharacterized protein n=1 Tax=Aegilops tauschii subsp. strangulata TaxID=200361 RepID=A0A453BHY2_AEGTS